MFSFKSKLALKLSKAVNQPHRGTTIHMEPLESRQLMSATIAHLPVTGVPVRVPTPIMPANPIQAKYQALGGSSSSLGLPESAELKTTYGGGTYEEYQNGAIFYSPATGAHDMCELSEIEFLETATKTDFYGKNVQSILGLPTGDEQSVPGIAGATYTPFQGGAIYQSSATGEHVLYGAIYSKYKSVNGPALLGLPTDDETATPDGAGRFNHFLNPVNNSVGAIDWAPSTGAHDVHGAVAAEFAKAGWEKNGEAVTDEIDIAHAGYFGAYNRLETLAPVTFLGSTFDIPVKSAAVNWSSVNGGSLTSGTQYSDIVQGNAGTCWIDASMASLENSGVDLSQLIHYQGNNTYTVSLSNFNNPATRPAGGLHAETETVYFDGTTSPADVSFNQQDPSSSWDVIMQRAVIQALHDWDPSQTIQNPHGGNAADALPILTGRVSQSIQISDPNLVTDVTNALAQRRAVTFGTSGTTATLVAGHDYAVLSANSQNVTLYNPWGFKQTVSWSVIRQDGSAIAIC